MAMVGWLMLGGLVMPIIDSRGWSRMEEVGAFRLAAAISLFLRKFSIRSLTLFVVLDL
jgi:hypothetical protein